MNRKQAVIIMFFILFAGILTLNSCKKDKEAEGTDKELYDMAKETAGFTFYKFSDALLDKSSGSGHSYPYLKTRYNTIAAMQLDSIGKIMEGAVFANGSLIVKDLYDDATTIGRYAILYKDPDSGDADANGWVWGYINSDGTVAETAENKGSACISCHSQGGAIDYMLMNKFFP